MRKIAVILLFSIEVVIAQNIKENLFGFATSNTFTYCDLRDTSFINKVVELNPQVLRFPGGAVGNFYHYGKNGYGFNFAEIDNFTDGKFPERARGLENSRRKKGHNYDYINDFIILAKKTNAKAVLVANIFIDNNDILLMIEKLVTNNIEVIGVELGSELSNRSYFIKGYTIEDYISSAKICSKKIKDKYPNLKTAVVAAPLGKQKWHRHNVWNERLSKLDFYDAIIIHPYAKVIKGKDLFGQMIIEEDEGLSEKEAFNIYKSRTLKFFKNDFPNEVRIYNNIFNKRPIWLTEWNLQMSKTTGNTMLQSLFVSNYFLEILSNKELQNISLTTYHNLGGRDYSGSIFSSTKDSLEIRSTYYTLKMIGQLFSLTGQIEVERKELNKDAFKYLVYNEKKLVKVVIINWSSKRVVTNNDISKKVQINSCYSLNLYDRANFYEQPSTKRTTALAKSNLILNPYSLSLIFADNE